ncbi:3-oxoacyl-reductase [Saccharata proteae CBS 121410]|uniref:3-oxoacyl-reductase n=1 Tax=Saccharata proteae CBS 121410 TaxID=1314787 RepID=A0A9P4I3Z7_9PEZI|nr:3-oxoacyl-reductase [Saccharata proteae CBS 121410]
MPPNFAGKVVLITGAGSGIGRATALKLSSLGAKTALLDINSGGISETARLCARDAHDTFVMALDVSSNESVKHCVERVHEYFGRIDHVFNCAGVNPTSYDLVDTTDEYWDKLVDTNLKGTYYVTRAAIPFLQAGASFVNVASIAGLHPTARQAIYCATKYGVIGFSKCMALELGPRGIRTNIVAPGYIDTPTNAGVVKGGEAVTRMEKGCSLERLGSPEEVADVVAFLFSDESRYMNGSVVEIDGGLRS